MITWLIIAVFSFILFLVGLVILFFQTKRKIGAIIISVSMLFMVAAIIGIFLSINKIQQVNHDLLNYSSGKVTQDTGGNAKHTYKTDYQNKEDGFTKKITAVKVQKKAVYSTIEGKDVPGSISITLEIKNDSSSVLKTYPNQGELITPEEQITGGDAILSDFPESVVKPGKTIKGTLVFPIKKITKVTAIDQVSLSWLSYFGDSSTPLTTETGTIKLK
ncbi:hypothetical protein [Listeria sp. PSOL-1]|uniref:hypothetical protein n=1 Tax=Listeria sp. PSOL-1 TaxID=1844999 RepID=UPI0013D5D81D|nr:hypothetical protein [Listeria sp. PSOL-1]